MIKAKARENEEGVNNNNDGRERVGRKEGRKGNIFVREMCAERLSGDK